MTEEILAKYLSTFFTKEEKIELVTEMNNPIQKDTCKADSKAWKDIEGKYKELLPLGNVEDFRLEVGQSGSFLIRQLFYKYVDDNTLVITSDNEHATVSIKCIQNVKHHLCIPIADTPKLQVDHILDIYKQHNCTKVLVYYIGTTISTGQITPQEFFYSLKELFTEHDIPHKMILDDVHGLFITPRDYSIFDGIVYTCHSLVVGYDMGLLLTKLPDKIGYCDYEKANNYLPKLNIVLNKFNKVRMFNLILAQLFGPELAYTEKLELFPSLSTPHIFAMKTKGLLFNQEIADDLFSPYAIQLNEKKTYEGFVRIRFQDTTFQSTKQFIEGIHKLKGYLRTALHNTVDPNEFTGEQYIWYSEYTEGDIMDSEEE